VAEGVVHLDAVELATHAVALERPVAGPVQHGRREAADAIA
jgi:nitrite reductase (NADH) small subunit